MAGEERTKDDSEKNLEKVRMGRSLRPEATGYDLREIIGLSSIIVV